MMVSNPQSSPGIALLLRRLSAIIPQQALTVTLAPTLYYYLKMKSILDKNVCSERLACRSSTLVINVQMCDRVC